MVFFILQFIFKAVQCSGEIKQLQLVKMISEIKKPVANCCKPAAIFRLLLSLTYVRYIWL